MIPEYMTLVFLAAGTLGGYTVRYMWNIELHQRTIANHKALGESCQNCLFYSQQRFRSYGHCNRNSITSITSKQGVCKQWELSE